MKRTLAIVSALAMLAGAAHGGIRADLSGDAMVDFATTMDMPLMNVGNAGNVADDTGFGAVGYEYRIGKFEVTAGHYTEFLNAVAATDTYALYNTDMWSDARGCKIARSGSADSHTYSVAADWEDRPVNYVSWGDAARFANWLTNGMPAGVQDLTTTEDGSYFLNGAMSSAELSAVTREADAQYVIPLEDEWYKAAYYDPDKIGGAGYWDYPTGADAPPSNILADPDPGNNANWYFQYGIGYTIGSPYYRTKAGEFENSGSPYGTFDQAGNVIEWTDMLLGTHRVIRGGPFTHEVLWNRADSRNALGPSNDINHNLGFRVSQVPEPASMGLLALGGPALLRRRK